MILRQCMGLDGTCAKGSGVCRRQGCLCECGDFPAQVTSHKRWTDSDFAIAVGMDEETAQGITGHMMRPSGATFMARHGVEIYKMQLFCRWRSDTVLFKGCPA